MQTYKTHNTEQTTHKRERSTDPVGKPIITRSMESVTAEVAEATVETGVWFVCAGKTDHKVVFDKMIFDTHKQTNSNH